MIDQLIGPPSRDVLVSIPDVSRVVGGNSEDGLDQRRFAASVRPDYGDELALVDVHVYAVQDLY